MSVECSLDKKLLIYQLDASDGRKRSVAAAIESGGSRLYSEDLQDGQKIEQRVIENPFDEGNRA